jgi:hypothetical protein
LGKVIGFGGDFLEMLFGKVYGEGDGVIFAFLDRLLKTSSMYNSIAKENITTLLQSRWILKY